MPTCILTQRQLSIRLHNFHWDACLQANTSRCTAAYIPLCLPPPLPHPQLIKSQAGSSLALNLSVSSICLTRPLHKKRKCACVCVTLCMPLKDEHHSPEVAICLWSSICLKKSHKLGNFHLNMAQGGRASYSLSVHPDSDHNWPFQSANKNRRRSSNREISVPVEFSHLHATNIYHTCRFPPPNITAFLLPSGGMQSASTNCATESSPRFPIWCSIPNLICPQMPV